MKKLFPDIPCIGSEHLMLRQLSPGDAAGLRELTNSPEVYRYLPTFLFEKKYADAECAIREMYDAGRKESLILGVFSDGAFCGLAEFYGYRAPLRKVSVGYRLLPQFWGRGIATKALALMVGYLFNETDIRIVTASVMPKNRASAGVLKKNGFHCVQYSVPENWGYALPTRADKWIKTAAGNPRA
ncbi:MAG: GNAT family N-acetyltransferase [Clostridia bacterium]|nr:GNAT family N-acetyltransferase [Clostridia bacterium]